MGQRDLDPTESLLQELLWTYGPCGQEDAVRTVCARELQTLVDDMWTDDAGNLIGYIGADDAESRDQRHRSSTISGGRATRVMAHMDELSMLVKRVETDGTLHMTQLGVMYPGNFGLGPVALLGDQQTLTAVLTLGSEHTTQESPRSGRPNPIRATARWIGNTSTCSPGAPPKTSPPPACMPERGSAWTAASETSSKFGDYVGAYFLDDRAAVTALLRAARLLHERGQQPPGMCISSSPRTRRLAGWAAPTPVPPSPARSPSHWRSGRPSGSTRPPSPADRSSDTATRCASTTKTSPTS